MEKEKYTKRLKDILIDNIAQKQQFNEAIYSIQYASAYSKITRGCVILTKEELQRILADNPQLVDLHLKN